MLTKRSWHVFLLVLFALAAFTLPTVGLAGSVSSPGYLVPTASSTVQVETLGYAGGAGYQDLRARNLISGTGALNTGATNGFAYTQAGAGAPVGVPGVLPTGSPPLYVDTTNGAVYAYYGAAWNKVGSGAAGSLQAAYNVGATIATSGAVPVALSDTNNDAGAVLTVNKAPGVANGGAAITATVGVNGSGNGLTIAQNGTGVGLSVSTGANFNSSQATISMLGTFSASAGSVSGFTNTQIFNDNGTGASTTTARVFYLTPTVSLSGAGSTAHYEGITLGVTETALGSGTNYLMRLMAGAAGTTDEFTVGNGGTIGTASGAFTSGSSYGFYQANGATSQRVSVGTLFVGATYSHTPPTGGVLTDAGYGFHNGGSDTTSKALLAYQNSAGVIGLLNPNALTTSCEFDVFNTADAANLAQTNSEALAIKWAANVCKVGTVKTGTGTVRTLALQTGGTSALTIDVNQTIVTAAAGTLAQGFTTGGLILPLCATGAPSGAATNGNIVVGADNNLWCRINGAWVNVNAGTTPTLGSVVNASNVVNGSAPSGQFTWTTGGTFAAGSTSQIYGPTDTGFFISAGTSAGAGRGITLTGSDAASGSNAAGGTISFKAGGASDGGGGAAPSSGLGATQTLTGGAAAGGGGLWTAVGGAAVGTDKNAGGFTADTGASTGAGTAQLLFNVPIKAATGSGANATGTVLTIDTAGCVYVGRQNATQASAVSFTGGQGGSTSGGAGNASLIGGASGTAAGNAGQIIITGGANAIASGSTQGGNVTITAGACSGTTSTGDGGAIVIKGGASGTTSGTGGTASLTGGAGTGSTSGAGGLATLKGGAGSTGSNNNNAGGCTISTGLPTGTGTANINLQAGFTLGSGSTTQTIGDRFYVAGHNITMSNTSATAIAVAILNVPTSNSSGGCMVIYQISANDGTNWNTATGSFTVSCSNKAGTVTATTAVITDESSNVNSGTLSAGAVTATVASQAVSIKLAPTFTVIVPTTVLATVTIIPFGVGVTVSPQ